MLVVSFGPGLLPQSPGPVVHWACTAILPVTRPTRLYNELRTIDLRYARISTSGIADNACGSTPGFADR